MRADTEVLGTLWAVEGKQPLGREAEKVLRDASRVASGHLLRAQTTGFTLQQHREDMLRQLLGDRVDAHLAADALGFDADLPAAVMGIALDSRGTLPGDHHAYRRLDELINARAMAFRWHVSSALAGVRRLANTLPTRTWEVVGAASTAAWRRSVLTMVAFRWGWGVQWAELVGGSGSPLWVWLCGALLGSSGADSPAGAARGQSRLPRLGGAFEVAVRDRRCQLTVCQAGPDDASVER